MEILVVIGITSLLSGVLFIYNRTGEKQLALFREQAKIINVILKAKSLALNTYAKQGAPCAYGFHIEKNISTNEWEFRIFRDLDASGSTAKCSDTAQNGGPDNVYTPLAQTPNPEDLDPPIIEKLDKSLNFTEPLGLTDITFTPPDPKVTITPNPAPANEITLEIKISDSDSKKIKINTFGQVTVD